MRIPVTTSLTIEDFTAGVVTVPVSITKNCIFGKRASGQVFATQRPGTNIFLNVSDTAVTDVQGRGIYYWEAVDAIYFVNNDEVYKTSYTGALTGASMTAGTERVEFFEVGDYLVIIDAENNQGFWISSAASTVLVEITDVDFPPKQTPALTLAKGGAVLNKTLFVMTTNGQLWNSGVEDPVNWAGTDFIEAEVATDGGVMCWQHSNHIAAIGNRSIEYFYWAGNQVGSPLDVRRDLTYDTGAADYNSAWADADQVFFVGATSSGSFGVYRLTALNLNKISESDLDSLLTTALTTEDIRLVGSGLSAGGRAFYILTLYYVISSEIVPIVSYVYDNTMGWSTWDLSAVGISHYPLVSWTQGTATRAGQGMLSNGDVISLLDDFIPLDGVEVAGWVETGWVEDGWVVKSSTVGESMEMQIITGSGDVQTREPKYQSKLRLVATETNASQNVLVQWSDNGNNNYNSGRNIDLSNIDNRLNRGGRFKTRNYKLTTSASEKVEIEAIEVDLHG